MDEDVRTALARLYDDPDAAAERLGGLGPSGTAAEDLAAVAGALANPYRARLLAVLRDGERCGCELVAALDAPQSTVSTHLRRLREAGLVARRREGRWGYYRLADPAVEDLLDAAAAVAGVDDGAPP